MDRGARLPVRLEVLRAWAGRRTGPVVRVDIEGETTLAGGWVSSAVVRLDLRAWSPSGGSERIPVVFKRASIPGHEAPAGTGNEVLALRAIGRIPRRAPALPELIDDGTDDRGPWVVMPFYPGQRDHPHGVPPSAFEALAQLHAHYLDRDGELAGLDPTDAGYWADICLRMVLSNVEEERQARSDPVLDRASRLLPAWAEDERFLGALAILPRTLVHGDMHPGNVLVAPGMATIIDWGNARVGPAMLDLANVTGPEPRPSPVTCRAGSA